MTKLTIVVALAAALLLAGVAGASSGRPSMGSQVVVPHGQPAQIAVALDRSTDIGAGLTPSIENAIRLAVALQPRIRGFRIQLNNYDAPCGDASEAGAAQAAKAQAIAANPQTAAVIGAMCSTAFGGGTVPDDAGGCTNPLLPNALALLEAAGIPAINGSTTDPCLAPLGPTVFDATAVPGPDFDAWYVQVSALPIDQLWRTAYAAIFGSPPTDYADLYFDATTLLLVRLRETSHLEGGNLVVDRSGLAAAVRHTTGFFGVTCTITIDPSTGYRVNDQKALARCAG
jgi:hypothetical protein